MSKHDPDLHLIKAHDTLGEALDLVDGLYLAGCSLGSAEERRAISSIAGLASTRIRKAQRRIDRYREAQQVGP